MLIQINFSLKTVIVYSVVYSIIVWYFVWNFWLVTACNILCDMSRIRRKSGKPQSKSFCACPRIGRELTCKCGEEDSGKWNKFLIS